MLRDLFIKFASVYPQLKALPFSGSPDTENFTKVLPQQLTQLASISTIYKVYGSCGKGNWSEIPWVGILDTEITNSTEQGYYIVFLYSADLLELNLCLEVGWEQFEENFGVKEGRLKIEQTVSTLKSVLRSPLSDFSFDRIDLGAVLTLGKGYESGIVCHKTYKLVDFPSDSELINDTRNMMGIYRELKGLVGKDIFNLDLSDVEVVNPEISSEIKPEFVSNFRLVKPPDIIPLVQKEKRKLKPVNFEDTHRRNTQTGLKGEKLVVENEKKFLSSMGRKDLADKVISISDDYSKGYDILSYTAEGQEKLIEVKSTLNKLTDTISFYISTNEKTNAEKFENYYIYLVFDVNSLSPKIISIKNLFSLNGLYVIEPVSYKVRLSGELDHKP